jgi:hypothetical protein
MWDDSDREERILRPYGTFCKGRMYHAATIQPNYRTNAEECLEAKHAGLSERVPETC